MWPFRKKPKPISQDKPGSLSREIAALVERARLGDQNAMAMIDMVNKSATKGVARARLSKGMIQDYIKKHPVVGADVDPEKLGAALSKMTPPIDERIIPCVLEACKYKNGFIAASLVLSYLGPINPQTVQNYGMSSFGSDGKSQSFFYGVQCPLEEAFYGLINKVPRDALACTKVGQCFGRAAQLQRLRNGTGRISEMSPEAGWELGE